ncbi:hypothetical protein Tco_0411168 [Tanacetum coccineum]
MELEPEIRVLGLECNRSLIEGVPFVNNMVIEESEYEMFFIDGFGDEAFQRMSDINKVRVDALLTYLVMASNITTPENTRFCLKLRKLIEDHPNQEKLQSKKVKLESVGYNWIECFYKRNPRNGEEGSHLAALMKILNQLSLDSNQDSWTWEFDTSN